MKFNKDFANCVKFKANCVKFKANCVKFKVNCDYYNKFQ